MREASCPQLNLSLIFPTKPVRGTPRMNPVRTSLLSVLLTACVANCYGQLDRAAILGTITDSSGGVVPNATVKIINQGTAAEQTLTTDPNGNFIAPVLSVGT